MLIQPKMHKVHNCFDVVVRDSQTNEIVKTGHAENVVLNQYYTKLGTQDTSGLRWVNLGNGNGTPAATDTALFAQWGMPTLSQIEAQVALPLSRYKYKRTLAANEFVGKTITELGLTMGWWADGSTGKSYLCTHAMLTDSEGNNISIGPKTDLQIIDIYVTVFVQVDANLSLGFVLDKSNIFNRMPQQVSTAFTSLSNSLLVGGSGVSVGSSSPTMNAATKTLTYPAARMANTAGNGFIGITTDHDPQAAKYCIADLLGLYYNSFGAKKSFPDITIFPEYTFASQQIGTGDGTEKFFNFESSFYTPGSSVVTVNDVAQVLGTDYVECPQGARACLNFTDFIYPGSTEKVTMTRADGTLADFSMFTTAFGNINLSLGDYCIIDFKRQVQVRLTQAYQSDYYDKCHGVQISDDGTTWTTPTPSKQYKPYWSGNNVFSSTEYDVPIKCRYMKITRSSSIMYAVRVFGWGSIQFTNPPAAGAVIKASWKTTMPPKSANFVYDFACAFKTLKEV